MITTMRSVMIIPASLTHQTVGSNPSLDPKRLLGTHKLALLTLQLLTLEHWEDRIESKDEMRVDGIHVRLLFLVDRAV